MAWNCKVSSAGPRLPPASLKLLVPPVRLMSAFVWQIVQQDNVLQFDKLLDFISLGTELVPDLLSPTQRTQLILGLRAKLVLELCRGDGVANLKTIQGHLDKIHACTTELRTNNQMESSDILKNSYRNFVTMVEKILNVPSEKELFFQEVFPESYGSAYNQRIQQLVSVFLSRLEELLPIPDLQQTTAWLTETSVFGNHLSEPSALKTLLLHHRDTGTLSSAPSCSEEDIILFTMAHTGESERQTFSEPYSETDDDDDEETLTMDDMDEESNQSLNDKSEDWVPKKKSGLPSGSFACPQCSFTNRIKRRVQEHIQRDHGTRGGVHENKPLEKVMRKTPQRSRDLAADKKKQKGNLEKPRRCAQKDGADKKLRNGQKEDKSENKKPRKQKEPTGEDKRFLSTRPANKIFTEEETKCLKCEKVFEHPNQLKAHMKIHNFRYSCSQCEKGFTSPSGYYQHQRIHKRGRIFTCDQCNKGFLCKYSLRQHERLHDGPSNFCHVCRKNFSKNGFVRHMQMHRGEKNYLCTTCGKSFFSSGELLLHNRSHTGEMPYTCNHCGKGFSCKSHLNVHTRSHTGERPYLCAECPKRFLTLNCLKRHALIHNGVKPFKCPNCEREFSQQGNLKRHMATHKPAT
ncbi:zinc finger protein 883-like isoform X1 [Cololabis saira]|uniref:zinc finger protein 883-like isoform X1 n=2 Tax=Cololabis saira TaxID=129043 RepID=UPI002AD3175F|nr:zinc finger protein 883-like isoform X1 [Cololabis saira]